MKNESKVSNRFGICPVALALVELLRRRLAHEHGGIGQGAAISGVALQEADGAAQRERGEASGGEASAGRQQRRGIGGRGRGRRHLERERERWNNWIRVRPYWFNLLCNDSSDHQILYFTLL